MTAPDPRVGEIEARLADCRPCKSDCCGSTECQTERDAIYLLAELRKAHEALRVARFVASEWEAELLDLKGPCRAPGCRLHYAHRGPCAAVAAANGDGQ